MSAITCHCYRDDLASVEPEFYNLVNKLRKFWVVSTEDLSGQSGGKGLVKFHTKSPHGLEKGQPCTLDSSDAYGAGNYNGTYTVNEFIGFSTTTFVLEVPYHVITGGAMSTTTSVTRCAYGF